MLELINATQVTQNQFLPTKGKTEPFTLDIQYAPPQATTPLSAHVWTAKTEKRDPHKPTLESPKASIEELFHRILMLSMEVENDSNRIGAQDIKAQAAMRKELSKKHRTEMKEASEKEQTAARWNTASQVCSWVASFTGIVAGSTILASGGAVAGALMIAGGVLQMTNQMVELTGGWEKVTEWLPGDDPQQKRANVVWVQIGVGVLCLAVAGAGVSQGSFSNLSDGLRTTLTKIGVMTATAQGVTTLGEGVTLSKYYDKMASVEFSKIALTHLRHRREDLVESLEGGVERLKEAFEALVHLLQANRKIFDAIHEVHR